MKKAIVRKCLKVKKGTVEQFNKVKMNPLVREQLLQLMNAGAFEPYYISFASKIIAQVYVFYELGDKNFADGKSLCYISNVSVSRVFRNMGLGTYCMEEAKKSIKSKGFSKIVLGVHQDNVNAIRFYEKLGFTDSEKTCDYDIVIKDSNGNKIRQKEYLLFTCDL